MKKPQTRFSIPEPCHENWNAMHPVPGGRHCDRCVKKVVDLTGLKGRKLSKELRSLGPGTCIRVGNIDDSPQNQPGWIAWLDRVRQRFLVLLLLFFLAPALGFSLETQSFLQDWLHTNASIEMKKQTSNKIVGVVLDDYLAEPVEHAQVAILHDGEVIGHALTDEAGTFVIDLKNRPPGNLLVRISFLGHTVETTISGRDFRILARIPTDIELPSVSIEGSNYPTETQGTMVTQTLTAGELVRERFEVDPECFAKVSPFFERFDDIENSGIHDLNDDIQRISSEIYHLEGNPK